MEKPLHYLQWHITHVCNLRCIHCYQEDYRAHMPLAMAEQVLAQYDAYLRKHGLRGQINLTGGEPLLHPEFFALAREIRLRGHRLGVLTNGTLIDAACAERLAALHPVFVQVSLDGPERIHDGIRGEGNFARAVRGIDCLKRAGVKVLVSFTAQKSNWRSFLPLAVVCRRHRVDKLWWDRVVTDDPAQYLTTEEFRRLRRTANRLRRAERLILRKPMVSVSRALQADNCARDGVYRCSAGGNLAIVLADGRVMPCRRLPYIIGDLHEQTLEELLDNSPIMKELARPRHPEACEGCKRFPVCGGGARCVTLAQTGDVNARDVNCFVTA